MSVGDAPGGADLPRRVHRLEQRQELLEHHYQVAYSELADLEQRHRGMSRMLQAIVTTQSEHTSALRTLTERVDAISVKLGEHDGRFSDHDARFDAMDQRFDAMDQRFDAMDQRFDAMDQRFDAMDARLDAHDTRFDAMDNHLAEIRGQLSTVIGILSGTSREN